MFNKRITPIQNIAYISLMSAINVIFVLLSVLFPPLMFILVFVLPLASAVVTIFCKKRYYPIYFLVSIALCLLASFSIYIYDTFFYVIPALITGFIFGLLIEKKVNGLHILTITSIVQYLLTYLSFILMSAIVPGISFFDVILNMFGLTNFEFKEVFVHVFCFSLGIIQNLFTYIVIKYEIKKLGLKINLSFKHNLSVLLPIIACFIGAIISYFVYAPLVFIFVFISLYYWVYISIVILISKKQYNYIFFAISLIISTFMFALLYDYPIKPLSVILLFIPIGLISIIYFVNNTLTKQ